MDAPAPISLKPAQADSVRAARLPADILSSFAGDPNFMLSLARGLTVLEAFSERKRPLTISQVAQRTQLSRASVRRCLYTLEQLGYVSQQDGHFALRPRVLHLGHAYFSSTSLVLGGAAHPRQPGVRASTRPRPWPFSTARTSSTWCARKCSVR